ncbi:MAG: GNAT family N-acetyltransferase [Candidatus Omnitrophota bacterium]
MIYKKMLKQQIISGNEKISRMKDKIISLAGILGDSRGFSEKCLKHSDILAVAREDTDIIGFSLARNSVSSKIRGTMFFATRILPEYQNQRLGSALVSLILKEGIKKQGINLLKPYYFVTGTAHPIVYAAFSRKLKLIPSIYGNLRPSRIDKEVARVFAETFSPELYFDPDNFIIRKAFSDSAEFFEKDRIPWAKEESVNNFFEKRLNLGKKEGNMLVILAKIPKLWQIRERFFG